MAWEYLDLREEGIPAPTTPTGAEHPGTGEEIDMNTETKVEPKTAADAKPPESAPKPPEVIVAPAPIHPVIAKLNDGAEPTDDPHWLASRLKRAENAWLKDLGVGDLAAVKKIVADANAKADAEKSEIARLSERAARVPTIEGELTKANEALTAYAKEEMRALTPDQRTAVKALAEDDPAAQLKTIRALRPTWAAAVLTVEAPAAPKVELPAVPAPQGKQEPAKRTVVPPAATTGAGSGAAPTGAPAPGQPDHLRNLQQLDATNPVRAAMYYEKHKNEIDAARAAAKQTAAA